MEPALSSKTGMLCEISGSFGANGWFSGKHEGEQVVVTNIFIAKEGFASKVSLKWHQSTEPPPPTIPPQLLRPVAPTTAQQKVLVVNGQRLGSEAVVHDINPDTAVITLSGSMLMVDCKTEDLCLLVDA